MASPLPQTHSNKTKKQEWIQCLELFYALSRSETHLQHANMLSSAIFLEFCQFHRIIPQAYKLISQLPEPYATQISDTIKIFKYHYIQTIHTNERMKKALLEIAKNFTQHNLEWLAFKGHTLSQIIYGNDYSRQFWDVDILVKENDFDRAEKILLDLGFSKCEPTYNLTAFQKKIYRRVKKDVTYYHPITKVSIELHWNLLYLFKEQNSLLCQNKQIIIINDTGIPTLSQTNLFIYLCIHGAYSYWSRLHWLTDIKDFVLRYKDEINWTEILSIATQMGFEHCIGQAFYLLNSLFKIPPPEPIASYNAKNNKIPLLTKNISKQLENSTFKNNLFLLLFHYYPLLFPKFSIRKRSIYPFFASPFVKNNIFLKKKNIFYNTCFFISFPSFMLCGIARHTWQYCKRKVTHITIEQKNAD